MTTDPTPNPFDEQDLTAFALGELDPAGETHRAIAAALADDPTIRAEIDAIKHSAQTVADALAHEPVAGQSGTGILPVGRTPDRQHACPTEAQAPRQRTPLFARPALLAAGFALAAGAAVAVVSMLQPAPTAVPHHADHATPRGVSAIRSALDAPVTRSFDAAPIGEVFAAVEDATHAEIEVDWEALEARGLTRETTLTFEAEQTPARDLLTLTLGAAWEQVPHPDPVVWSVTADQVRIEARSAAVQRTLDLAREVLAQVNTTNARMSGEQLALVGSGATQQPGEWTQAYWSWAEAYRETVGAQQAQQQGQQGEPDAEYAVDSLAIVEPLEEAEQVQRITGMTVTNGVAGGRLNAPMAPPSSRGGRAQLGVQLQMQQAQTRSSARGRGVQVPSQHFYAGSAVARDRSLGDVGLGTAYFGRTTTTARVDATRRLYENQAVLGEALAPESAGRPLAAVVVQDLVADKEEDFAGADGITPGQDEFERLSRVQDRLVTLEHPEDPYSPGDSYALVHDNPFRTGMNDPLSTFSVDVDTAAYAIVRRQLVQQHVAPVPEAVRIEEMVNYFGYDYAAPKVEPELLDNGVVTQASLERLAQGDDTFAPFATHVEVTDCPWAEGHRLVRIGIKGMEVEQEDRPAAHLTFLLDVSGSMNSANKLPLVKESLKMLLSQLNDDDHVSIVVYAGAAGLVLEHASAADLPAIEAALDKLSAGGSTAGGAGIELAYDVAQRHYIDGGVNRVILCTDGDFNVGISDRDRLVDLIKDKANPEPGDDGQARGVYLSVMGFGFGNLNDNMMEPLTNAGNGNYAYIDTADEAHKVMVEQVGGTLVTIAKDVKIQVEFNPSQVLAYRLIGYENRVLAAEDFANDTVDAGDIGAGHTVTALYEVVPFPDDGLGDEESLRMVKEQIEALDAALAFSTSVLEDTPLTMEQYDKLVGSIRMMQQQRAVAVAIETRAKRRPPQAVTDGIDLRYRDGLDFIDGLEEVDELLVVNLRYKPVDAPAEQGTSRLIQTPVGLEHVAFNDASESTRFAAAVAGFGMVLRHSPHRGEADLRWVLDTANGALGDDAYGYRAGFVELVELAARLVPEDAEKERNAIAPRERRQPAQGVE